MRAAPAFQVTLCRPRLWQGAVWMLAATVWVAIGAWWMTFERPAPAWLLPVAITIASATAALGASLARVAPATLHWDGAVWHFGRPDQAPVPGRLEVAIDFGAWMLLRFVRASGRPLRRAAWLPVGRSGLAGDWHALRCAVHAPPPPRPAAESVRR